MLLILSVFSLIYALFHGIGIMEIGSISDWVSSLSTLGTLCVAFVALRKAPEWMEHKHYDIVHDIVEEVIYNKLHRISAASFQLHRCINKNIAENKKILDDNYSLSEKHSEMASKLDSEMDAFTHEIHSISNGLNKIKRYNYIFSDYSNHMIDTLKSINNDYYNAYDNFLSLYFKIEDSGDLQEVEQQVKKSISEELTNISEKIKELAKRTSEFISLIYESNYPIDHFIKKNDQ